MSILNINNLDWFRDFLSDEHILGDDQESINILMQNTSIDAVHKLFMKNYPQDLENLEYVYVHHMDESKLPADDRDRLRKMRWEFSVSTTFRRLFVYDNHTHIMELYADGIVRILASEGERILSDDLWFQYFKSDQSMAKSLIERSNKSFLYFLAHTKRPTRDYWFSEVSRYIYTFGKSIDFLILENFNKSMTAERVGVTKPTIGAHIRAAKPVLGFFIMMAKSDLNGPFPSYPDGSGLGSKIRSGVNILEDQNELDVVEHMIGDDISWVKNLIHIAWQYHMEFIDDIIYPHISREDIIKMMLKSTPQERVAIIYRYRDNLTLEEIGKRMGLCKESVRLKLKKHMRRMYHPRRSYVRFDKIRDFRFYRNMYEVVHCYKGLIYDKPDTWRTLTYEMVEFFTENDCLFDYKALILFRRICAYFGMYEKLGPYDVYNGEFYYIVVANNIIYEALCRDGFRETTVDRELYQLSKKKRPRFMHSAKYIEERTKMI